MKFKEALLRLRVLRSEFNFPEPTENGKALDMVLTRIAQYEAHILCLQAINGETSSLKSKVWEEMIRRHRVQVESGKLASGIKLKAAPRSPSTPSLVIDLSSPAVRRQAPKRTY